ncbi:MAG TPA: ABC transporter permease [Myxococcota bacterium]|nr:ABC transporter permease [Myxococcota bacterium]
MDADRRVSPGVAREATLEIEGNVMRCAGAWTVDGAAGVEHWLGGQPRTRLERALDEPGGKRDTAGPTELLVDGSEIVALDTAGAWLLQRMIGTLANAGRRPVLIGFRTEHSALLQMVGAPAMQAALPASAPPPGRLARIGHLAWTSLGRGSELLAFVGEVGIAAARSAVRPAHIRWRPILYNVRTAGFDALPITGLLVFLMGIVIAYQGATQLKRYGANIFIADLVGLAMLRELSPLLTAIIVAGRSGSAYAAQIGTMKVTEEIDALRTVGIPPLDQLVLPKLAALVITLPLLTVYADALGVAGGMVMARGELGVGFPEFADRLQHALYLSDFLVGIGKAPVFAAIISVIGCFQGFQVTGDAESVGRRTTVSVVQSIFLVIIADALFSVVFERLGL